MAIKIHGKDYTTVAERVTMMRNTKPDWSLESEIVSNSDIIIVKAVVRNDDGRIMGVGHAEEVRGSTNINKTSALENCETSAWGRALAACGWGGDQVASANEVGDAIIKQAIMEATDRLIKHNDAVRDNMPSILAVKIALAEDKYDEAAEYMAELDEDVRISIGLAATKGGVFDLKETKQFRSPEYSEARTRYFDNK